MGRVHSVTERQGAAGIVLYTRPGCAFCTSLRRKLRKSGLPVREIDIWQDGAAAEVVRAAAGGHETVPTVVIADVTLVNPSYRQVLDVVRQFAPESVPVGASRSGWAHTWRRLIGRTS